MAAGHAHFEQFAQGQTHTHQKGMHQHMVTVLQAAAALCLVCLSLKQSSSCWRLQLRKLAGQGVRLTAHLAQMCNCARVAVSVASVRASRVRIKHSYCLQLRLLAGQGVLLSNAQRVLQDTSVHKPRPCTLLYHKPQTCCITIICMYIAGAAPLTRLPAG